jgi:hyperosmotically inducible periplasmic protein
MKTSYFLLVGLTLCVFAAQAANEVVPANNSGINERDRSDKTLTPENQSETEGDRELAAKIRRAVVGQSGISTDGQNIKIITANNTVTLRGPVKDSTERAAIEKTVRAVAGQATVDNQLEVK